MKILLITTASALLFLFAPVLVNSQNNSKATLTDSEGYRLLKTYCYVCHNPNVTSHDQMLAPPIMMVKKHYKPAYPNKQDFIDAIVSWVHHPSKEKALMPGAVRKFKIMPPLAYPENDLKIIAEYIFDNEQEKPAMMQQMQGNKGNKKMTERSVVALNDGKKWKVDETTIKTMNVVNQMLERFSANKVSDYHELGKLIFEKSKTVIMDNKNEGAAFEQLHNFFHGLEKNMHKLMEVTSMKEGEKYKALLELHARKFNDYFED